MDLMNEQEVAEEVQHWSALGWECVNACRSDEQGHMLPLVIWRRWKAAGDRDSGRREVPGVLQA